MIRKNRNVRMKFCKKLLTENKLNPSEFTLHTPAKLTQNSCHGGVKRGERKEETIWK